MEKFLSELLLFLPFELQIRKSGRDVKPMGLWHQEGVHAVDDVVQLRYYKPLVRSLGTLEESMIIDGEVVKFDSLLVGSVKFLHKSSYLYHNSSRLVLESLMHTDVLLLAKYHFDLYGWLDTEDAINIDKK